MSRILEKEPEVEKNWEDEALNLKSALMAAKMTSNEQIAALKAARAKELKLERKLATLSAGGKGKPRNKENEELIDSLQQNTAKLRATIESLRTKNDGLVSQLEKKDRQLSLANRRIANLKKPSTTIVSSSSNTVTRKTNIAPPRPARPADEPTIQPREAEESLPVPTREPDHIQSLSFESSREVDPVPERDPSPPISSRRVHAHALAPDPHAPGKLKNMQQRYDLLNTKFDEQLIKNKHMSVQLLEYIDKVKVLRQALEDLRNEKRESDAKGDGADEIRDENDRMRIQIATLEERVAHLCSMPFASVSSGDDEEGRLLMEKVVMERDDLVNSVRHLEEAVKTNLTLAESAKAALATTREDKEKVEARLEEALTAHRELEMRSSLLEDKLKLYSEDDGLDHDELDRALTSIRRAHTQPLNRPDFLEHESEGDEAASRQQDTVPLLRRRVQELQEMAVHRDKEMQRLNSMLKLESSLSKDLRVEVDALTQRCETSSKDHKTKLRESEALSLLRLEKIRTLEAQIRQVVYSAAGKGYDALMDGAPPAARDRLKRELAAAGRPDAALLADLLRERGAQLQPDENLLEVWVRSVKLSKPHADPESQCFVVVDFFTFESQATQLMGGSEPAFDFAATFKVTVDDSFMRYIAAETMTLELGRVENGKHATIGRTSLPIAALLTSKASFTLQDHPLLNSVTNEIIATVTLDVKLALPVSELYRFFKERNPTEAAVLVQRGLSAALEAQNRIQQAKIAEAAKLGPGDDAALWNEVEIAVDAITNVTVPGDRDVKEATENEGKDENSDGASEDDVRSGYMPSPYLHLLMPGFPERFTSVIANTRNAAVGERFSYSMATSETQLRTLRRSPLEIELWDMGARDADSSTGEGLLGRASVDLAQLSLGVPQSLSVPVLAGDNSNTVVATVVLAVAWLHPLVRAGAGDPRALTRLEVEQLVMAFSVSSSENANTNAVKTKSGDGRDQSHVVYSDMLYHMNPPDVVLGVMEKLREYALDIMRRDGLSLETIFGFLVDSDIIDGRKIKGSDFLHKLSALQVDVLPNEYVSFFKYLDREGKGEVLFETFLQVMNPVGPSGVSTVVQNKIATRCAELDMGGLSAERVFEAVAMASDMATSSSSSSSSTDDEIALSRYNFEQALHKMGFNLLDPSAEDGELDMGVRLARKSKDGAQAKGDASSPERGHARTDKLKELRETLAAGVALRQATMSEDDDAVDPGAITEGHVAARDGFEAERQRLQRARHGTEGADARMQPGDLDGTHGIDGSVLEIDSAAKQALITLEAEAAAMRGLSASSAPAGADSVMSLAAAEMEVRAALRTAKDLMHRLRSTFRSADRRDNGVLLREQFEYLLTNTSDGLLSPGAVRQLGVFFSRREDAADMPSDGEGTNVFVDYHALLSMCDFKDRVRPRVMQLLADVALTSSTITYLRDFLDTRRAGLVDASAFMTVLRGLLGTRLRRDEEVAVLNIFSGPVSGFIDYINFVQSMGRARATLAFRDVERAFMLKLTNGEPVTQPRIRYWFARIANKGESTFGVKELRKILQLLDMTISEQHVLDLLLAMSAPKAPEPSERESLHVPIGHFDEWLTHVREPQELMAAPPTPAAVRRKALACFAHAATEEGFSYDGILECFHIYDWSSPPTGFMQPEFFAEACTKAGFFFTDAELGFLVSKFGSSATAGGAMYVEYNNFLEYACPEEAASPSATATSVNSSIAAALIKERLLTVAAQGEDILTLLRSMDSAGSGLVTGQEASEAFTQLPALPSISRDEAMAVAGLLNAVSGQNLIMYRKFVHNLLMSGEGDGEAGEADPLKALDDALMAAGSGTVRLRDMFEYYDRKKSGSIDRADLGVVLEEVGCMTDAGLKPSDVEELARQYIADGSLDGQVLYRGILAHIDARRAAATEADGVSRDMTSEAISKELADRLTAGFSDLVDRGTDFRGAFDALDEKCVGSVLALDVEEVLLRTLGWGDLTQADVGAIIRAYMTPGSDARRSQTRMNYVKFIRDHHLPRRPAASSEDDHAEAARVADELRGKVTGRYGRRELRRPFRHFARRRGEVGATLEDLEVGLADLGIQLSPPVLHALFRLVCAGRDPGTTGFRFADFSVFVRDPYFSDVEAKFHATWVASGIGVNGLVAALTLKDTSGNGVVSMDVFDDALGACGLDLSPSDVSRLALRFDSDGDGRVDIEKFFGYIRRVATTGAAPLLNRDAHSSGEIAAATALSAMYRRVRGMLADGRTEEAIHDIFTLDNTALDIHTLQVGARRLGQELSRDMARTVLRKMCYNVRGLVDASNLMQALGAKARPLDAPSTAHDDPPAPEAGEAEAEAEHTTMVSLFRRRPDFVAALTEAIAPLEPEGFTLDVLLRELQTADKYELDQVERVEFTLCLRRVGMVLRHDVEKALAEALGEASDGGSRGSGIEYRAFVDCLRSFYTAKLNVNRAIDVLRAHVSDAAASGRGAERIFDEMDRDHDGELGITDVSKFLAIKNFGDVCRGDVMEVMQLMCSSIGTRRNAILLTDFEKCFARELADGERGATAATPTHHDEDAEPEPLEALRMRLSADVARLTAGQHERYLRLLSRRLGFHDVMQSFDALGVNVEPSEVDILFDHLDSRGQGMVDGQRILNFMGLPLRSSGSR